MPRLFRTFLEQAPEIDQFTLRFVDHDTERAFQTSYQRDTLPYVRLAYVLGVAGWILFGFLARRLVPEGGEIDTILRYGVAVPLNLAALACTYAAWWRRRWQPIISLVLVANALIWSVDRVALPGTAPADWGYAGMMLILAFAYVLSRVQFVYAAVVGAVSIAIYDVLTVAFASDTNTQFLVANYFLVVFAFVGMAASYGLDRSARLLFLRERQLDAARVRADELLHNTLPAAIVERLKARGSEPGVELLADGHEQVTVVFADLVSFTEHAERIAPAPLVAVLDEVFTMFDDLAQRVGLEKIKTVGDAYMAVAGAPEPRPDHAQAAAEMALQIRASMAEARWPTGEPDPGPRRHRDRPGGGRGDRPTSVRLRPVGRHREPGEPPGIVRSTGGDPRIRDHCGAVGRPVRAGHPPGDATQGQGRDTCRAVDRTGVVSAHARFVKQCFMKQCAS